MKKGLGLNIESISTYAAEFLVLIGTVLVYKIAGQRGEQDLDAYVVVRRYVSFFQPILLLGVANGLTRYVALSNSMEERLNLFRKAVWVIVPLLVPFALVLGLLPELTAQWIFGSETYSTLMLPMVILTLGIVLYSLVYAYYRGVLQMLTAGSMQVLMNAVIPIAAFYLFDSLPDILLWTGVAWCSISLAWTAWLILRSRGNGTGGQGNALLRYGIPRLPGDFALVGMITLPVFFATTYYSIRAGGEFGFGITLLNIVGAAMAPLGILLLPKTAERIARKDYVPLRSGLRKIEFGVPIIALLCSIGFYFLAPILLRWYLGETGQAYVQVGRLLFLAAAPYAYFLSMRSAIDAFYTSPQNGINQSKAFLALVILLGVCLIFRAPLHVVALVVVAAFWLLGLLTYLTARSMDRKLKDAMNGASEPLKLLVVIPSEAGSTAYPFSRRQAEQLQLDWGADVRFFYLANRTSLWQLFKLRAKYLAAQREFAPDVIHGHYGSVAALFAVLFARSPVVISYLGSDLNNTPKDGFLSNNLGRFFSQIAAFLASGIICVSKGLRDQLWWRRNEVLVSPLAADLRVFKPMNREDCRQKLNWDYEGPVVLFNGNNPFVKRQDIADETISLVKQEFPDASLHTLKGRVPFEEIPLYINASNVLLLCSDSEGSPSMVKEAMVCNLPVVSNDVGDVLERTQGVFPGGIYKQEASYLADGIKEVLRSGSPSNGREMAKQNRADAYYLDQEVYQFLRSKCLLK